MTLSQKWKEGKDAPAGSSQRIASYGHGIDFTRKILKPELVNLLERAGCE